MGLSWFVVLSFVASVPAGGADVVATAVLEEGRLPRRALRMMHPVGGRQRARLSVETEWDTRTEDSLRTEYGPEVELPLMVALEAEPGREHARYQLQVGRPEVRAAEGEGGPEQAWAMATELAPLNGGLGGFVLSATGRPVEVDVKLGEGATPTLEALVREVFSSGWCVTPQFPEEPVGVGARWAVARSHGRGSLAIISYELVELRGTRGRVRFQLQRRQVAEVEEASSSPKAEGELRFDLRSPLPELLEVRYTARESLAAGSSGQWLEVERRTLVRLVASSPERAQVGGR